MVWELRSDLKTERLDGFYAKTAREKPNIRHTPRQISVFISVFMEVLN